VRDTRLPSRIDSALARLDQVTTRLETSAEIRNGDCEDLAAEIARVRAELEDARGDLDAATRGREQFLAVLSHELRTPLNAILGWTSLLRQKMLTGESAERALGIIERNARVQARYLNDLLDVWRLTDGRVRVDLRPVDFDKVVAHAAEACRPELEAARVEFSLQVQPGCCRVVGDEYRLQQVATHLLLNAARFTPEGGRVEVTVGRRGRLAVMRVRDTGQGLERGQLAHVFDRFWQADPRSAARRGGGLGLGLTIAKQLVELHGGTIAGESAGPGRGATFSVRLPLLREHRVTGEHGTRASYGDTETRSTFFNTEHTENTEVR
jgi:signal transduction histidine kinase